MIFRTERVGTRWQFTEQLERPCFVDQNVAAVASFDRLLSGAGIARNDDAAVGSVESVPVALHGVFRGERGDCDPCVSVDDTGLDFVGVHSPALRVSALVSFWICAGLYVYPISLQKVLGHGL